MEEKTYPIGKFCPEFKLFACILIFNNPRLNQSFQPALI